MMEWYEYPRIDNFGVYPDPVGWYPKPDSNFVGIPDGTPITALGAGTVTGARRQPWGPEAWSITVRLDKPYNAVATHMAYNYVSDPQVKVDDRVDFGTPLARSGNPYDIGTAFAFCDADVYGTSTKNEPFSGTYINPLLNPVPFLDVLNATGTPPTGTGGATAQPSGGLARLGQTILAEIGVSDIATAALDERSLTYIGAGVVGAGLLAGVGVLFLLTGGL